MSLLNPVLVILALSIGIPLAPMTMPDHAPVDVALDQAMTSMSAAMARVQPTGNSDADFATMMIPHHKGAIEMAKVELQYGTDPRLRRLAQEIIVTQNSEIELMQLALKHSKFPTQPMSKSFKRES